MNSNSYMYSENDAYSKRLYIDIDGTLARFHDVDKHFIEAMWQEGFYRDLKPFENMVEAAAMFVRSHPEVEVFILSAVLDTEPPFAEKEKNEWLDQYLPEIDAKHRIFTKAGTDKTEYLGTLSGTDFLIDDYNRNLREFEAAGGKAIKFQNDINHRGEGAYGGEKGALWQGDIISHHLSPAALCEQLESIMGLGRGRRVPAPQLETSPEDEYSFCIANGIQIDLKQYTSDEELIKRLLKDEEFKDDVSMRFEKELSWADSEISGDEILERIVVDEIGKKVSEPVHRSLDQKIADARDRASACSNETVFDKSL